MNIINIQNISGQVSDFAAKNERQLSHLYEPYGGAFIAESAYVIDLALSCGYEAVSFVCKQTELENPVVTRFEDLPVYTGPDDLLKGITGFDMACGILCKMKRKENLSPFEVIKNARRVAVLEHIMNPANVGAIIRSAAALGIDGILLTDDCADPLYRRAARVSMGSVFKVPFAFFEKGQNGIDFLKQNGFVTVAMALTEKSVPIDSPLLKGHERIAIVLGSEGEGLCQKTIDDCNFTAKIPMSAEIDSLNVAAASAVAFWEIK